MYSKLNKISTDDAIHIIYYIIKILNKGKNGPDTYIDFEKIETELNEAQLVIADDILEEMGIDELNDDAIDKIIMELSDLLKEKTNSSREINTSRGKELLRRMKEDN